MSAVFEIKKKDDYYIPYTQSLAFCLTESSKYIDLIYDKGGKNTQWDKDRSSKHLDLMNELMNK